jgi:hypothetical protein
MRENTPSADDGDAADESFDGAQIDPIASSASSASTASTASTASRAAAHRGLEGQRGAPGWTQRLSLQGKLARAGRGAGPASRAC